MGNMSVSSDFYPHETRSFNALPQDSPIQHLDYGGLLTMLGEFVHTERKMKRNERREFLIKKVNNVNMNLLINTIKREATHLRSYASKDWTKGKTNKVDFSKFFQKNDISLMYLEDMFEYQEHHVHDIKVNDIIKVGKWNLPFGMVTKIVGNNVQYVGTDKNYEPLEGSVHGFTSYNLGKHSMNIWKCKKVQSPTDIHKKFESIIQKDRANRKERNEFWDNHPVLRNINKPYYYHSLRFNPMIGRTPHPDGAYRVYYYFMGDNIAWDLFNECLPDQ